MYNYCSYQGTTTARVADNQGRNAGIDQPGELSSIQTHVAVMLSPYNIVSFQALKTHLNPLLHSVHTPNNTNIYL